MDASTGSTQTHLLLVDDDRSSLLIVGTILRQLGFQVEQASSAMQAQKRIEELGCSHFDLVLSDYWMPEQNGLELLKNISLEDPTLSVILMTADEERKILENLIQISGCGFLQKPIRKDSLKGRVEESVARTRKLRHLRSTELEANTLGENQRILLQKQLSTTWPDIEFFFTSKSQASGDFVSAIPLQNNNKILLISDASGHELSSALQSNYFHGLARGMLTHGAAIEETFEYFNKSLTNEWNDEKMLGHSLAAIAIQFDGAGQSISYLNAGSPHPMLCGVDGFARPVGLTKNFAPLGWFDDKFQCHTCDAQAGYLCAWTDGLADLAESFGVDPLALTDRFLQKDRDVSNILAGAKDDIAAVRVKTPATPPCFKHMIPLISLKLTGDNIHRIDPIQAYCEKSICMVLPKIHHSSLSDLLVCIREALVNALKHGCKSSPDLSAELQVSRSQDGSKLSVQIQDHGSGHNFDWQAHTEKATEQLVPAHRGLIMLQAIPSRVDFSERGSLVKMEFDCEPSRN